jgi:hypothetical protein
MKFNGFSKVLFDLFMLLFFAVVYCAQSTGIPIHEYVGLSIFVLFTFHLGYNHKWIVNVGKRFFDKTISIRIKFMYIIDFLLVISFILIGFSGIMISRVIFKIGEVSLWRPVHAIISAISIVLLGIHIGLHGKMIINVVKTKIKLSFSIVKTVAVIVFIVILSAGVYGDVFSKMQTSQNQMARGPQYETVLILFQRCINFLSSQFDVRGRELNGRPEGRRLEGMDRMEGRVRSEMRGGNNAERTGGDREIQKLNSDNLNLKMLLISGSNYIAFILLLSIIVFLIDNRLRKKTSPTSVADVS